MKSCYDSVGRTSFLQSQRLRFSHWREADLPLARTLWGNPEVSRYICAARIFAEDEITSRLAQEMDNLRCFHVQYYPLFERTSGAFVGCCGLRPHGEGGYELGFHLLPDFWGKGYATEAAKAVIDYAFQTLGAKSLFAGHNPKNAASGHVLQKLGFQYIGDEYYAPTGLYHPSYRLTENTAPPDSV